MARTKSTNYTKIREEWKTGNNYKFTVGDVCKRKNSTNNTLYVIIGPSYDIGKYDVKVWDGPNPWDYIQSTVDGLSLEKIDHPNPTIYPLTKRYPGPSNDMMEKLTRSFNERRLVEKNLSFEEREQMISYLDEEMNKKRKIDDDDNISSTDDDDDDDGFVPDSEIGVDPVEKKRKEILELD